MIPPAFIVASQGPIDGAKELIGADAITAYDEDSYFLKHAMMIDCSKNWFLAALYLAAITFDAAAKEKVAILAILLMRDPAQKWRLHETASPRRRRRALANAQRRHREGVVPRRLLVGAVQVIQPAKESIAPYPSLEGITGNPVFLPICGTQIVLLTLGVLFASPSTKKKKPAATRATRSSTRAKRS